MARPTKADLEKDIDILRACVEAERSQRVASQEALTNLKDRISTTFQQFIDEYGFEPEHAKMLCDRLGVEWVERTQFSLTIEMSPFTLPKDPDSYYSPLADGGLRLDIMETIQALVEEKYSDCVQNGERLNVVSEWDAY